MVSIVKAIPESSRGGQYSNRCRKLIEKARNNPKGLRFSELATMCRCADMELDRISGSHHIYVNRRSAILVSIQRAAYGKAKPYQVRQVLALMERADLEGGE